MPFIDHPCDGMLIERLSHLVEKGLIDAAIDTHLADLDEDRERLYVLRDLSDSGPFKEQTPVKMRPSYARNKNSDFRKSGSWLRWMVQP